jgi:hypothetical protein
MVMHDTAPTADYSKTLCSIFLKTADHHKKSILIKIISVSLAE